MKTLVMAFISIFVPFTAATTVAIFAASKTQDLGQNQPYTIEHKKVDRAEILRSFLEKYNSPLVENAETFIEAADRYNIDFRILPAISCMESTCGKALIPDSYNPFGWGVYGNGSYIAFNDYDEAIHVVAEGLNTIYFSKGLNTLEKIAPVYTPPNHKKWLLGVNYFIDQMDEVALDM